MNWLLRIYDTIRRVVVKADANPRLLPHTPNAGMIAAMCEADRGEGERFDSADALYEELGI